MTEDETTKLRRLLETKLPQELYDKVYDLTFTASPGVHYIQYRYPDKPPPNYTISIQYADPNATKLMQVDRASRKRFATSFYGGEDSIFVVADTIGYEPTWCENVTLCHVWLKQIPVKYRRELRDIRVVINRSSRVVAEMHLVEKYGLLCGEVITVQVKGGEEDDLD